MKNELEYFLLISLEKIFSLFGIKSARRFAKFLALFFYYVLKIRRTTVFNNLHTAFPELTSKEIKSIAVNNYKSFCLVLVELFFIKNSSKEKIVKSVDCADLIKLNSQGRFKNGGFFLTAHYGNWEIGGISAGLQLNIEMNVLAKPQRNTLFFKWLNEIRESFGNKVIPLGPSVREVYKAISERKMVGVVGDQRGPIEADRVKFFSKDTAVFQGTASIAIKKNVPIVTALLERQNDYTYKAIIEEIDYSKFFGSEQEIIHQINQEYMNILERQIRKKPEQWFWMHKIWKY